MKSGVFSTRALATATLLLDAKPGEGSSSISNVECKQSTAGVSRLFFTVGTQQDGGTEWVSDGRPEGTTTVDALRNSLPKAEL